jgi:hypothetical protein
VVLVGRWWDCELEAAEVDDGVTRYSRHHRGEKDEGDMWGHYVSGREGREVRVGAVVAGLVARGRGMARHWLGCWLGRATRVGPAGKERRPQRGPGGVRRD